MPQLWLTYQELADELACDGDQVRATASRHGWTRKRSGDGLTRVLLPHDLMYAYFASVTARSRGLKEHTDVMAAVLRATIARTASPGLTGLVRGSKPDQSVVGAAVS